MSDLTRHHAAKGVSDRIALGITKLLRFLADTFFAHRYGHRAIVLETVAGVPGMVGGMMQHLKSLRRMRDDDGWIRELIDEAENERMHLMAFVALFKPNAFERFLVLLAQGVFWNFYFVLYRDGAPIHESKVMEDVDVDAIDSFKMGTGEVIDLGTFLVDA